MSTNARIFPRDVSGCPFAFQNSMRFPVPVCTFTMMSPTVRRSFTTSTPSHGSVHAPPLFSGSPVFQSSLQRCACQITFHSSFLRS